MQMVPDTSDEPPLPRGPIKGFPTSAVNNGRSFTDHPRVNQLNAEFARVNALIQIRLDILGGIVISVEPSGGPLGSETVECKRRRRDRCIGFQFGYGFGRCVPHPSGSQQASTYPPQRSTRKLPGEHAATRRNQSSRLI